MIEKERVISGLSDFYNEIKESGNKFWTSGGVKAVHLALLKNAIEALNGLKPVEPEPYEGFLFHWKCPVCHEYLDVTRYCSNCGREIDWKGQKLRTPE